MSYWYETAPEIALRYWVAPKDRPVCSKCGIITRIIKHIGYVNAMVFTCPKCGNDYLTDFRSAVMNPDYEANEGGE
jgi:predicted RNA-binding Zn-ribbon protein involved in translation (DUF1610 family)